MVKGEFLNENYKKTASTDYQGRVIWRP